MSRAMETSLHSSGTAGSAVAVAEGVVEGLLDELGARERATFVGDGEAAEDGIVNGY